jgi:TonB family protein
MESKGRGVAEAVDRKSREPLEVAEFSAFAHEDREDDKHFKWSLWIAAGVHAVFLIINFPALSAPRAVEPPPEDNVFVVESVRWKPPPVLPERQIPQERARRVPIPDPTPDDPEPLRVDEPEPVIELPVPDVDFAIPEAPPAPELDGPIYPTGEVVKPVKVHAPPPEYTEAARVAKIQGTVILSSVIDRQGRVTRVKVLKGLPMGLSKAAVAAVEEWRFKPATLAGKPIEVYYNLTVTFTLQ